MREPNLQADGWCLECGDALHAESPNTFWLPPQEDREKLEVGDRAKLVFQISVADPEYPIEIERMWVIVRKRVPGGYLGILDNDPGSISENEEFWSGIELPFQARHVIDILKGGISSRGLALRVPKRSWQ